MTRANINRSERRTRSERVVVDCAGAIKGGAARFLRELQSYIRVATPSNVELIGLGQQLTSRWLVEREVIASSAMRRISLNNAGFLNPTGQNITLLRNILQFATRTDLESLGFKPNFRLRAQTPVVRGLARFSDTLVVPCTRMSQKVETVSPSLKNKLIVRFHPVSRPHWAGMPPKNVRDVLLPVVPSPYKNLDQHISEFLRASQEIPGEPVRLIVPSTAREMPRLVGHPRINFIGPQSTEHMDRWWRDSGAVFFPTEFESFGYALAEARVYGRSVIAQDTPQNREIAGVALRPYRRHEASSLQKAIKEAINSVPASDPGPFEPNSYFQWLLTPDGSDGIGHSMERF